MRAALRFACAVVLSAALGAGRDASAQPAARGRGCTERVLDFSAQELAQIASHGPWPPPASPDPSNRVDGKRAAQSLGRSLFFDTRLSADGRQSCATCHVPERAFQDGNTTARGGGLRNTPSLWNAAQQRWFGWGGTHDSVWSASLTPLLARQRDGADRARAGRHRAR